MAVRFQDIINEAAGHLGVYTGDPLAAADLQTFFFTLLALIDGWGGEPLTFFDETIYAEFSTQAGKQTYNVGLANTNDWVLPATSSLPPSFSGVGFLLGALERQLDIRTAAQWRAIALKSMQSGILEQVWPNLGTVSHQLSFWPVPNAIFPINLYVPQQVAAPSTAASLVVLPPVYQEALTFELTIKASSKFRAKVPAWIPAAWEDAKEKIRGRNFQAMDVQCDAALLTSARRTGGGSIDFYLGK